MDVHGTIVSVSITPELDAFLQGRVISGRYGTKSEVVREALRLLQSREAEYEDAVQHLKAKLERGARQAEAGELLDGDAVFEELQIAIEQRVQTSQSRQTV
jgi:antitoxin ParD1/3/4